MSALPEPSLRDRADRCPGVFRPWPADDGLLVRLRLIGGAISGSQLRALAHVADRHGDGRVHVTSRANLQVRALPGRGGRLSEETLDAIESTWLLPSRSHELVRNVMISPQTGYAGGRADLRPVGRDLDALLCARDRLGELPGRFLFVLDDGRGDLLDRACDLGVVALDETTGQLRIGDGWGPVVNLADAAAALVALATDFLLVRGDGPSAPWHVRELPVPLGEVHPPDPWLPAPSAPLGFGTVPGGRHVRIPDDGIDLALATELAAVDHLVVTPWHGVFIPQVTR